MSIDPVSDSPALQPVVGNLETIVAMNALPPGQRPHVHAVGLP
jgi:hypothetical protein